MVNSAFVSITCLFLFSIVTIFGMSSLDYSGVAEAYSAGDLSSDELDWDFIYPTPTPIFIAEAGNPLPTATPTTTPTLAPTETVTPTITPTATITPTPTYRCGPGTEDTDCDHIPDMVDLDDDNDGTIDKFDGTPGGPGTKKCTWGNNCTACWVNIDVKYRTFIPCEVVAFFAGYYYGGDNRGYSLASNSYRTMHKVNFTDRPYIYDFNFQYFMGVTKEYYSSDIQSHPTDPYCAYQLKPSAIVRASCTNPIDNSRIDGEGILGDCIKTARMELNAENCRVGTSSRINADMYVQTLIASSGKTEYRYYGFHDRYPGHEIYLNGTFIYGYNPRDTGQTVHALILPMMYVEGVWTEL